jgi:hypothetical protein
MRRASAKRSRDGAGTRRTRRATRTTPREAPEDGQGKPLIVVESPAKTRTLKKILGEGYRVEASMGHVRDLPEKAAGRRHPQRLPADLCHAARTARGTATVESGSRNRAHRLSGNRPRSGRGGDCLAHSAGVAPAQPAPHRIQRNHRIGGQARLAKPAHHRHESRQCAASTAHPGPPRGI